jgi:hypothetical protein
MKKAISLVLVGMMTVAGPIVGEEEKWESLFDGKTLAGWEAPEMSYWSVEDGAITATSTEKDPCTHNQFLLWQGGELGDFVLKLSFRIEGGEKANSGIQIRSQLEEDGHVVGYQADITKPDGRYLGCLYDEHGRKMLAERGQRTVVGADGAMEVKTVMTPEAVVRKAAVVTDGWNRYEVSAKGDTIRLAINGIVTAEVKDLQEAERELSGLLALQLHSGPPMKVQFKDIQLKPL